MPKVHIGEKWEDPTLDNPILRRMPVGERLHVPPPEPAFVFGDKVVYALALIGACAWALTVIAQVIPEVIK